MVLRNAEHVWQQYLDFPVTDIRSGSEGLIGTPASSTTLPCHNIQEDPSRA